MNWDVVDVKRIGHRVFHVRFMDGLTGTFSVPRTFCTGVFQPLLDDKLVEQARIEHGVVVWPNGLDLAPDTMYREIQRNSARHYEVGVSGHTLSYDSDSD